MSYDLVYAWLVGLGAATWVAPLLGGAAAGAAAWVPVYPIDVVKTNVQMEIDGGRREGFVGVAKRLWAKGGAAIFWDGLGPKLARAVVNHAVTFWVFDSACGVYVRMAAAAL